MGLFKKFKKALPAVGAAVGFAFGGPTGAALGSGIGSLASGKDIENALINSALAYGVGAGSQSLGFQGGQGLSSFTRTPQEMGGFDAGQFTPLQKTGVFSSIANFAKANPGLTAAGIGAALPLLMQEEEEEAKKDMTKGIANIKASGPLSGEIYNLGDESQKQAYTDELMKYRQPGFDYRDTMASGGEVTGPGTGTSDSVPARLSDGEFVLTAKAVRGAGGGDRDVGAARLYDMMSVLERGTA